MICSAGGYLRPHYEKKILCGVFRSAFLPLHFRFRQRDYYSYLQSNAKDLSLYKRLLYSPFQGKLDTIKDLLLPF